MNGWSPFKFGTLDIHYDGYKRGSALEMVAMAGLAKRASVSVARHIYRQFIERPLWWFLDKVKAFFFAEVTEQLSAIERRLTVLEQQPNFEARFTQLEAANAAQWDAIEQLLLALFRQPQSTEPAREDDAAKPNGISRATESSECRP